MPRKTVDDDDILAEIAAAEAAATEARERATAARARAKELRRKADAVVLTKAPEEDLEQNSDDDGDDPSDPPAPRRGLRGLWGAKGLVIAAALLVVCGSLAVSTVMVLAHRDEVRSEQMAMTYSEAAENMALTLMAIDYTRAQENVQEILDVTTGKLREQYEGEAADAIVQNMEESKVVTRASVVESAVESMDADQAVVLLAIRTQRTSGDEAPDPNQPMPTLWRLALTLVHEGDQLKVSNLEYL